MLMATGVDYIIADPLDEQLQNFIRIVNKRDNSTGVGNLLLTLYDKTVAMDKLTADDVDMGDSEQVAIFKTAQILYEGEGSRDWAAVALNVIAHCLPQTVCHKGVDHG